MRVVSGIARAVGAVVFSIVIGLAMHLIYKRTEAERAEVQLAQPTAEVARPLWQNAVFFGLMIGVLVFANWGAPADAENSGLGGDIPSMVQTARDADVNLVIDGCPMDCAKKVFDRHGVTNYRQIKVTELGIEKVKGGHCLSEQVDTVVAEAGRVLGEA